MGISEQEGAEDFISIKQVWLKQIDRCNEILSNYVLKGDTYSQTGELAAVSSVGVLILNLIDYGDAPIKTEYKKWYTDNRAKFRNYNAIDTASTKLEKIIAILNKYQMLHDALPRGYTNVILEGVKRR